MASTRFFVCAILIDMKKILLVLGAIIIIAVLGRALWAYQKMNSQVPVTAGTSLPTVDEMAGWKTYTNDKYGLSFKYPPGITAFENDGDGSSTNLGWIVINGGLGKSMDIYIYTNSSKPSGNFRVTQSLENGNYRYEIATLDQNRNSTIELNLLQQILSTFKFTK